MTSTTTWGESVAEQLLDAMRCPVCLWTLVDGCCARCGSDLRGPVAVELWDASLAAAESIRIREGVLRRVPVLSLAPIGAEMPPAPAPVTPPPSAGAAQPAVTDPQSSATLQSVLATAGAGLFAVAAIVFTYANPDLTDKALRSVIVGLVTLLFLGGAWLLSRRGLRSSAEAVGGLGLVFAGLDIHAVAQLAAPQIDPWFTAGAVTAVAGAVMLAAGRRYGIRVWQWTAALALAVVPAMLGLAGGTPLIAVLGVIGVSYAAAALIEWVDLPRAEKTALVVVQLLASVCAVFLVWGAGSGDAAGFLLTASALLALISAHAVIAARGMLGPLWAYGAGGTGAAAVVIAAGAVAGTRVEDTTWLLAIIPAAASLALVLLGALLPLPRGVARGSLARGALTVLAVPALGLTGVAAFVGVTTSRAFLQDQRATDVIASFPGWGAPVGLAAMSIGLAVFSVLARERDGIRGFSVPTARLSLIAAALAALVLGCGQLLPLPASIIVLLAATVIAAGVVHRARTAATGTRVILLGFAHATLLAAVMISWRDLAGVPLAGAGALVALTLLAATMPARFRFLYVGAGFAYALGLTATALGQVGVGGVAQLCLTASAGLLVAIVATYLPRIGARAWQAVLVVSAVPFGMGVLQVLAERSGWTALSTGIMFVLALSLLITRRPGLTVVVRTAAAGLLVPTLAVVIVCLGAQLLASSGSPVALPLVGVLVALALASGGLIRGALVARGTGPAAAEAARIAIEVSALITAVIAVALALGREAAGLGTAFLVLLALGLGAVATAMLAGRRYAWAVAGIAFTGALWCVWGLAGVDLLEAYLLPPTLGAAIVAAVLTGRGARGTALYAAGLLVAIGPILAITAVVEPDRPGEVFVAARVGALMLAAAVLLALAAVPTRGDGPVMRRLRSLRIPTLLAAGLAGSVGPVYAVRVGAGQDLPGLHGAGLFFVCLGASAAGAVVLLLVAGGIRRAAGAASRLRTSRWPEAPAALALAAGTWCAIERDWFSIWAMWALMLGYLAALVLTAARMRRGPVTLPPVWFLFAIAFVTAIVAWSPRDLRVEWFSLPLGAFLLVAGAMWMATGRDTDAGSTASARPTLDSWPGRWGGSWALLAPGIVVMMSASIVSTFTDPLTWRAILVMVLALAAILVGSRGRLAAPFLLGLIVLPIENVFVFSVQIGRGIESMPWWITLAVMGAVLLIIAVTAERRTGESGSVAARIRDLR